MKALLVGTHFRGAFAKQIVAALTPGDEVLLQRELDNQHDVNAIAVYKDDEHIGFISRDRAAWLAPTLDEMEESGILTEEVRTAKFLDHVQNGRAQNAELELHDDLS